MRRYVILVILLAIGIALIMLLGALVNEADASCRSHACWKRVHQERVWDNCVERHGGSWCVWRKRFRRETPAMRNYAFAVFRCEGGKLDNADGSGFQLRAEWTWSTWYAAGGRSSHPSVWEEAVRVIRWTSRVGFHTTAGWPNCP